MWAHPYLQAVNEINAVNSTPRVWQHDGPVSETFGLAPTLGSVFYPQNHVGRGRGISNGTMGTVRPPKILVLTIDGFLSAQMLHL